MMVPDDSVPVLHVCGRRLLRFLAEFTPLPPQSHQLSQIFRQGEQQEIFSPDPDLLYFWKIDSEPGSAKLCVRSQWRRGGSNGDL
jgi:hypothetical protein